MAEVSDLVEALAQDHALLSEVSRLRDVLVKGR